MKMYQVDAFTGEVFRGNPAAVLILDQWLADATMQAIANENNLAETAYARPSGSGWDLRWFTPTMEVDFCGHATLATAHVLATEYGVETDMHFTTRVGPINVAVADQGYRLDIPAFEPEPLETLPPEIAGIFENTPENIFRNFENIFAELTNEAAVRGFEPDLPRIAELGPVGLVVTARGVTHDFVSRYFVPGAGIPEDPVTGSIHATLVPYWAKRLGKARLSAHQASARGGELDCESAGDRVYITGRAATFMEAVIRLPRSATG